MPEQSLAARIGCAQDPRPLQLLGETGYLYAYLGNWDKASEVFEALSALTPADPIGPLGLSEVYLLKNEYEKAEQAAANAATLAIDRDGGSPADRATAARAHVIRGKALMHLRQAEAAAEALGKAVQLDASGVSGRHAADLLEQARLLGLKVK